MSAAPSLKTALLTKVDWIDGSGLKGFILRCQDAEDGGIAERPGNLADIFHTFFGIAGLSLLGYFGGRWVELVLRGDTDTHRSSAVVAFGFGSHGYTSSVRVCA